MTKLFVRLYLLVAGITFLALGGVFVFMMLTHSPAHNNVLLRTLEPALRGLASELAATAPGSQARAAVLQDMSRSVGSTLAILPREVFHETDDFDASELKHLDEGHVLVTGSGMGRFAYITLPDEGNVVELELYGIHSAMHQWSMLAARHAQKNPETDDLSPTTVPVDELELSPLERARLAYRPVLSTRSPSVLSEPSVFIVFNASGSGQATMFNTSLEQEDPRWVFIMIYLILSGIATAVVLVPIQRKLTAISGSAEAFAQGDLEARTGLRGDGPLEGLGQRFDRMADGIKAAIQNHEELLRAVSHELKTPLTRLLFLVDEIRLATENPGQRRLEPLLKKAERNVTEVSQLINELIDYRRICAQSDAPLRATFELSYLLDELQGQFPELITDASEPDTVIRGNPRLLLRALRNLVANAEAYGHETVLLTCTCDPNQVIFTVEDDGPGIPADMREEVLKPFVRLESSRSREHGGSGLGLAIVARIVEHHRASLGVQSSIVGGAKFTLSVPRAVRG